MALSIWYANVEILQGLPVHFCKTHLPKCDEIITFEQEEEFSTKYLAEKTGLSGGWRGFSIEHELVDGDALVFQLVTPKQFKVATCSTSVSTKSDNIAILFLLNAFLGLYHQGI